MPGATSPADDSVRDSNNSSHGAPITPLLKAKLVDLNPEIRQRVSQVVSRKGKGGK